MLKNDNKKYIENIACDKNKVEDKIKEDIKEIIEKETEIKKQNEVKNKSKEAKSKATLLNNNIYEADNISNFKELLNRSFEKYANNVAYKYKLNMGKQNEEIIEKRYSNVKNDVQSLGTMLLNLGLENEKVILISNNRYEWCISYFAITTSNIVVVPLDKALPEEEICKLVKRSNAKAAIYDGKYESVFKKIYDQGNVNNEDEEENTSEYNLKYYINMDLEENSNFQFSYSKLLEIGANEINKGDNKYFEILPDANKLSVLIFTSGTTAESKGVMLSQNNICSNIVAMAKMSKMYETDVILSFLPLHHTFECTITFLYGFYSGATVVFCDGLKYIAKNLKEYKITNFVAVPLVLETIYRKIEKNIKDSGKEKLVKNMSLVCNKLLKCGIDVRRKVFKKILNELGGNIRILYFGAAPMNKEVIEGYNNFGIDTVQGYGLTETSPLVSAETDLEHMPGSVGMAPFNVNIKLLNKDEKGVGEIAVKGPNVMLGYYENEKVTKEAFKDGWFKTGDLGYFDEKGYLWICGRKKEVIVLKNGENVYPNDIEYLVNQMSYVEESIVFPRENAKSEINLGIKIVLKKEAVEKEFKNKTENELKDIIWEDIKKINAKLSQFKRIKELIVTEEPLEKTTTKKIKRFKEIEKIIGN